MAKQVVGDTIRFDAEGQGEGYGPALDGVSVVYNVPLYVRHIKVNSGAGGDLTINSRKISGDADPTEFPLCDQRKRYEVLFLDDMDANEPYMIPMEKYVDGLYIEDLQTNMVVTVELGYA